MVDDIIARLDKCDVQRASIDALAASLETGKAAVIAFLEGVGREPERTLPAEILFREAKARFDQLLAAWGDAKARSLARRRVERYLAEADNARKETQTTLADLRDASPGTMPVICLSSGATSPHAE